MKIASIRDPLGSPVWGVVDGDRFVAAPTNGEPGLPPGLDQGVPGNLLEALSADGFGQALAAAQADLARGEGRVVAPGDLLPPLPSLRRNVFCLGPNYADHAAESRNSPGTPAEPVYFSKATTTLAPPEHTLSVDPRLTERLDWEIELAVVIGQGGRNIDAGDALKHVLGYSVAVDFSARDVQGGRPEGQWFLGKSLDGFFPMGPCIVTTDELPDPQALDLVLRVNDEPKQQASTGSMVFTVARIIEDLSRYVTLLPGDVISTGTPGGVGDARNPPERLGHGDRVTAEISGIGRLSIDVEVLG